MDTELSAILEASHDGIVIADNKGTVLHINSSYEKITGVPREELIAYNMEAIVAQGIVSGSTTLEVLANKKEVTFNQTFKTGRHSVVTGSPVYDERGKIKYVITNVRDMTEIYRLTEELEKSKEKLNQYSEIVKTLTAKQIIEDGGIFKSPQMEKIIDNILKFAKVEAPVLITGESGVGKEVVADLIYKHGTRNSSPFIKINCAAIPETLLESELFGYEGGSFSGAKKEGKRGLLELADSGTVLLDEIGEIAAPIQAKLLRFIQNKEFYRIGGKHVIKVDVRVIAATNQSLEEMVKEKMFRMDLFYRLNVLSIHIPPLRERPADIIPMANYFLRKYSQKYKTNKILAPEIYLIFTNYAWNGNIRELENLMERLIVTCDKYEITAEYLPEHIRKVSQNLNIVKPYTPLTYAQAKAQFEKNFFGEAIAKYKTSRKVAENLQVDHSTVVKKSQKYGLKLLSWEKNG